MSTRRSWGFFFLLFIFFDGESRTNTWQEAGSVVSVLLYCHKGEISQAGASKRGNRWTFLNSLEFTDRADLWKTFSRRCHLIPSNATYSRFNRECEDSYVAFVGRKLKYLDAFYPCVSAVTSTVLGPRDGFLLHRGSTPTNQNPWIFPHGSQWLSMLNQFCGGIALPFRLPPIGAAQPGSSSGALFAYPLTRVYGLLSRSLPPACLNSCFSDDPPAAAAAAANRGEETTRALLPVKFPSAGGAHRWPCTQPLLGPYE